MRQGPFDDRPPLPSRQDQHPLKRTGTRGGGEWRQISWDRALDEVAGKLDTFRREYGPETLAFTHGTDRTYHWDQRRFFNLFGSPNTCGANNVCYCPSVAVDYATYGGEPFGDMGRAKCIVIWGHASSQSYTGEFKEISEAKKKGAALIVIDPRRIREAEMADIWLPIRPGTDVALMLGWLRIIIEEKLYDRHFVEQWTAGFEALKRAVSGYTPDRVAKITWLDPGLILKSARCYATSGPAVITWGLGID
ncbi:MAG: molybdopterin-dependent oxidoreductase, partial [Chlorobiales bacterium]|nr:molybdopterin-dependent oxidoreductase [Chlorobiales bacterium]